MIVCSANETSHAVQLHPREHYEKFVRELVESGRYNSASEVLRDGLRLLEDAEVLRKVRTEELKRLIQEGLDSGDAGPLDMEDIIAEAKRLKASPPRCRLMSITPMPRVAT